MADAGTDDTDDAGAGRVDDDWWELPDGSIQGPDGAVYRRTPERVKRRNGDAQVAAGAAVMTDVYPEGPMWWDGGETAADVWTQIAPHLVVGKKPAVQDLLWVGHVWAAEDGRVLLHFAGEH